MSSALARKVHWSEQEYLTFEKNSETKHEFLDGEVYAMAGARSRHNAICARAIIALGRLTDGGPCGVFTSDQRIRVQDPRRFYTYADAGVCCGDWQISALDGMSLENPALIVEVLSASTREYDRGAKLVLYQHIPSLTDVLLIDQPAHFIEHHHRGPRGWKQVARHRGGISVLGGVLQVEEIYNVPPGLPDE